MSDTTSGVLYQAARFKKALVYVVGAAGEALTTGLLHGTAEHVVQGVVAVAALFGIVAAQNAPEPGTVVAQPDNGLV
jgi:hypothetical protein